MDIHVNHKMVNHTLYKKMLR